MYLVSIYETLLDLQNKLKGHPEKADRSQGRMLHLVTLAQVKNSLSRPVSLLQNTFSSSLARATLFQQVS